MGGLFLCILWSHWTILPVCVAECAHITCVGLNVSILLMGLNVRILPVWGAECAHITCVGLNVRILPVWGAECVHITCGGG